MNSSGVYFYLVTALAYITVCYATGLEVFPVRLGDESKTTVVGADLPKVGTWLWPKTDTPCVMVQFAIQLNISYMTSDSNSTFIQYNVPTEELATAIAGSCLNDTNSIQIQWKESSYNNSITVEFMKNSTTTQFMMSNIKFDLYLDSKTYPGINTPGPIILEHSKNEFTTAIDMSYHCTKPQHFNLTNTAIPPTPPAPTTTTSAPTTTKSPPTTTTTKSPTLVTVAGADPNQVNATFVMAHVQLEAFNTKKTQEFATAMDCDATNTPDIVPIAVGCALAGLIVIVLIAYLVGRRRAQARGYLSM